MHKHSLDALVREHFDLASRAPARRSSTTVVGGHERAMRQTLVCLLAESSLDEHDNPGEASLIVLRGRIEVSAGGDHWDARTGDIVEIPQARHSVRAHEDSAVLLTAVPREHTNH